MSLESSPMPQEEEVVPCTRVAKPDPTFPAEPLGISTLVPLPAQAASSMLTSRVVARVFGVQEVSYVLVELPALHLSLVITLKLVTPPMNLL